MNNRFLRLLAATLCTCTFGLAGAQNNPDNLDWVEQSVPPPPAFSVERLMPLDMPPYVSVSVGIDPQTLNVGEDGVVRYVVVMRNSSGTVHAAYEGIRCFTRDFKTYARWTSQGTWSLVSKPEWRALNDNMPSRHAMAFARQGACDGAAANSVATIQKAMKLPQGKSKSSF
jgi:hypothetical protein